jgi:hypothetical protein
MKSLANELGKSLKVNVVDFGDLRIKNAAGDLPIDAGG